MKPKAAPRRTTPRPPVHRPSTAGHARQAFADNAAVSALAQGRARLYPEAIQALQSQAGNAAVCQLLKAPTVQRVAMGTQELKERGGAPKEDKVVQLPHALSGLPVFYWHMSKGYTGIIESLRAYHEHLDKPCLLANRAGVLATADDVEARCKAYLKDHKDARKGPKKESSESAAAKAERRRKRYEAVSLLTLQIAKDKRTLEPHAAGDALVPQGGFLSWRYVVAGNLVKFSAPELGGEPATSGPTESHVTPSLRLGLSAPTTPMLNAAMAGQAFGPMQPVGVVAQADRPKATTYGTVPLYTDLVSPAAGTGGTLMNQMDSAQVTEELVPNRLFIGETVRPDEIAQGGIGNCYVLAAVASIAAKDPVQIVSMMKMVGTDVVVTFHRLDPKALVWVPQAVRIPQTLRTSGGRLVGSGFKVASHPRFHHWWAELTQAPRGGRRPADEVRIHRADRYQAALWAPYLEKAHARFAETYGQYGTGKNANADGKAGYELISSGQTHEAFGLFYGGAAQGSKTETSHDASSADADNLAANTRIVALLLQMKDRALQNEDGQPIALHLTASTGSTDTIRKAAAIATAVTADGAAQAYLAANVPGEKQADFAKALRDFRENLAAAPAAMVGKTDDALNNALLPLQHAAGALVKPGTDWFAAFSPGTAQKPKLVDDLFTVGLDARSLGRDTSYGQRHFYAGHAYTVLDAVFRDSQNAVIGDIDHAQLDQGLGQIDIEKSTVTLYNPHRANTPNPTGAREIGHEGRFDLTLRKFLVHVGEIEAGKVRGRRNP